MKDTILHTPQNLSFSKEIVKHLPQAMRNKLSTDIAIVSVSEKKSLGLNRAYRNKRKPANVLSFFYGKEYGEIILCPVVIRREALEQKHSYKYQMTWMIVHGMIHLAGLHHETSARTRARFEKIEQDILKHIAHST